MSVLERGAVALSDGLAGCDVTPQGGAVTAFWWGEGRRRIDWIKPVDAAAAARGGARACGCFPLVPWGNRIRNGRFQFCGHEVVEAGAVGEGLAHAPDGHGWRRAWRVAARDGAQVILEYEHAPGAWPWRYRARQTVALEEGGLRLTLTLENLADGPMPAGLGFHAAFPRTPDVAVAARTGGVWRTDRDLLPDGWSPMPPEWDFAGGRRLDGLALDHVLTGWDGTAAIAWPERRARLAVAGTWPILSFLAVSLAREEDHFCLRPSSQCADAVNLARAGIADTGLRVLAPGAARSATVTLRPQLAEG